MFSRDGFKSKWFGPIFWSVLHRTSSCRVRPVLSKELFLCVGYLLPCVHCRNSYQEFLQREELAFPDDDTKGAVHVWLWQMHNCVNEKLGLEQIPYSSSSIYDVVSQEVWVYNFWLMMFIIALNFRTGTDDVAHQADVLERFVFLWQFLIPFERFKYRFRSALERLPLQPYVLQDRCKLFNYFFNLSGMCKSDSWQGSKLDTLRFIEKHRATDCRKNTLRCE